MVQAGLTYSKNPFDRESFLRLHQIASELLQNPTRPDLQWPKEPGYTTPKIDVRGVLFQNDQILLIKELLLEQRAPQFAESVECESRFLG